MLASAMAAESSSSISSSAGSYFAFSCGFRPSCGWILVRGRQLPAVSFQQSPAIRTASQQQSAPAPVGTATLASLPLVRRIDLLLGLVLSAVTKSVGGFGSAPSRQQYWATVLSPEPWGIRLCLGNNPYKQQSGLKSRQ